MKRANFQSLSSALLVAGLLSPLPSQAQTGAPAPSTPGGQWLTYKGDLQRTNAVAVKLGAAAPNLVWRHSTELAPRSSDTTPLVVGPPGRRRIYFSLDRLVICIDGETGQQLWRSKPLSSSIASPIAMLASDAGDLLLAVTNRGQLNALRTSDGGSMWQVNADQNKNVSVINTAPFFVQTPGGERIVLALGNGRLVAFTPQGALDPDWQVVLGSSSTAPTATPATSLDGKFLYVPTQDKKVWVVNVETARVEFSINTRVAAFASPIIVGDHLITATDTSLNGLKLRTGQSEWIFDVKSPLSAPAARAGEGGNATIFVGARNGKFYALNAATGAVLWDTDLADSISGTPTVAEDMVLVGTRSGLIFGLAPDSGKILWRYRLHTERLDERPPTKEGDGAQPQPQPQPVGFGTPGGGLNPDGTPLPAEKNPPLWEDLPKRTFGVSTTPVVLDGQLYVLADNAALYSFSTSPFDADPPQLYNPQLSVPNVQGKPALQRLDSEKSWIGSGKGPVEFTAEISDAGSGIDPATIRVRLNKQELPASALAPFSDISGKLLVKLTDPKSRTAANLEDGNQTLEITARDYRGNEMTYSVNFLVDNTLPQPAAPAPPVDPAANPN